MIKAVIFDMDGVISDSQKQHSLLESKIFARFGINISPEEITRRFSGVMVKDFFTKLFTEAGVVEDIDNLVLEKRQAILNLIKEQGAYPIPGIFELLARLKQANLKLAIGSASSLELIDAILESLNIQKYFLIRTSGHEVKYGKPAPDIFLLAAKRLEIIPNECLVIEDGISGMQAAKKAGMKSIGLVSNKTQEYPADVLVTSLDEITLELIETL